MKGAYANNPFCAISLENEFRKKATCKNANLTICGRKLNNEAVV